jgi:putative acyl-CoA dehydrogenase
LAKTSALRDPVDAVAAALSASSVEANARSAVERLALIAAGDALAQCAPAESMELFVRTRLQGRRGATYGSVAIGEREAAQQLQRALPA